MPTLEIKKQGHNEQFRQAHIFTHEREYLDLEGRIALSIIEKHAMVAAVPNGEDSAGRQQFRLPQPFEFTARALDIAHAFIVQARERGLVAVAPTLAELDAGAEDA